MERVLTICHSWKVIVFTKGVRANASAKSPQLEADLSVCCCTSGYMYTSMSRVFQKYCNGLPNPMLISTVYNLNKLIFPSFFKLFNTNSTLKSLRSIFPIIFCYDSILICLWAHIPPIPLDFMIRARLLWSVVIANFELQSGWCQ